MNKPVRYVDTSVTNIGHTLYPENLITTSIAGFPGNCGIYIFKYPRVNGLLTYLNHTNYTHHLVYRQLLLDMLHTLKKQYRQVFCVSDRTDPHNEDVDDKGRKRFSIRGLVKEFPQYFHTSISTHNPGSGNQVFVSTFIGGQDCSILDNLSSIIKEIKELPFPEGLDPEAVKEFRQLFKHVHF